MKFGWGINTSKVFFKVGSQQDFSAFGPPALNTWSHVGINLNIKVNNRFTISFASNTANSLPTPAGYIENPNPFPFVNTDVPRIGHTSATFSGKVAYLQIFSPGSGQFSICK